MKVLDRYISWIFIRTLIVSVVGLGLFMTLQSLMVDLFNREFQSRDVIIYQFMRLPSIMVQLTAPATLLATVLTLSGLSRSNELVACYSIGVGLKRISYLFLSWVFIQGCLILIVEDRILPPLYKARVNFYYHQMKKRPDFFMDIKQDKIWYRSRNLIYNLQRFDVRTSEILGMSVYTFDDDFNLIQVVSAQRAQFTPQGWRLKDGQITHFPDKNGFPVNEAFKSRDLAIAETPQDFREIEKEVDGLRVKELYRYVQRSRDAGADTKGHEVKLHSRFSLAAVPLVMCILGIPFSTRGRREGGAAKDFGFCLGLTFFYWLFYSVGLSLGEHGYLPPWMAAWLPTFIFLSIAVFLLARKKA